MWGKKKNSAAAIPTKASSKGALKAADKDTSRLHKIEPKRPTISATTVQERLELVKLCEHIGALAIGGRGDKVGTAVEMLQKQARSLLMQAHLDVWLPKFDEHFANLEKVLGPVDQIQADKLVTDIKERVANGGFPNVREFLIRVMLPLVSYHGLLLFLNNSAGVRLPDAMRDKVVQRMNMINRVLGGSCAAMVLQESMSVK